MFSRIATRHFVLATLAGLMMAGLTGCAADRPRDVPPTASLKAQGDERVVYNSSQDGTIWVTEPGSNQIVWSGEVKRGDRVVLDPDTGKLIVNDRVVADKGVARHDHKVFFLEGPPVPSPNVVHDSTIARPAQVPAQAMVSGEGKDRVEFTPTTDGAVWVVDTDNNTVIYAGHVMRGETMVIDPKAPKDQEMTVGGRSAMAGVLPNDNRRVFFQPGAMAPAMMSTGIATPASTAPALIPAMADLRAEGNGKTDFTADNDGTVWVVDTTNGKLLYSGRMAKGDMLSLDPATARLTLNNRAAYDGTMGASDRYRVFFQKGQ